MIQQTAEDGPVGLTQRQTEAIAGDYYRDLTSQHGNEPGSPKEWDAGLTAVQEPDTAGLERMHGEDADRLLMGRGLAVDDDSRARLLQSMHRAFVQFGEQQVRRGSGDWSPDAAADRFPAFEDATTSTGKPMVRCAGHLPHPFRRTASTTATNWRCWMPP